MTRITNSDQVILLLQNQLKRMDKPQRKRTLTEPSDKVEIRQNPLARVQSIAKEEDLTEEDIHRSLIRGLLTEEFGIEVANDPAFQKVIDDVLKVFQQDDAGADLLKKATQQLTD